MKVLSWGGEAWSLADIGTEALLGQVKKDKLTWIRAGGQSPEDLERLGKRFGLHPLTLEDVQSERQRPKVEDYPGLTFTIVRIPHYTDDGLSWDQIGLFLGTDFLITASLRPIVELDSLQQRLLERGLPEDRPSVCTLLHLALDALVDAWFPYISDLEDEIEELEDQVVDKPDTTLLRDIRALKQILSRTRKVSVPMREATLSLERMEHPNILPSTRIYLRDVSDHMVRISERLEHVKEMTLIAQETWNSTLANQQNTVMKRLTVIAALLLLPSLIAGLGGMNFERGFPQWGYWQVTTGILAFVLVGIGISLWRKWL